LRNRRAKVEKAIEKPVGRPAADSPAEMPQCSDNGVTHKRAF
jgi:hypothetical protein